MVLGRHFVAHIPIDFPTAADGVAWIVVDIDIGLSADRVSRRDVTNEVVEVQVLNVPWVLGSDHLHAVLCIACLMEVDSVKFTFELSSNVLHVEVFVDGNEPPMTHEQCLARLFQDQLWVSHLEQKIDQVKAERRYMVVWSILNTTCIPLHSIFIAVHLDGGGEKILRHLGMHQVWTEQVSRVTDPHSLLIEEAQFLGKCLPTSLMILTDLNPHFCFLIAEILTDINLEP